MDCLSEVSRSRLPGSIPWNFSVVFIFLALFGSGLGFKLVKNGLNLDIWNRDMCADYQLLFFAKAQKFPNLSANQRKSMDNQNRGH